ncbi:MAG: hypothetical protein ACLR23_10935 [Clostridia bacterium]
MLEKTLSFSTDDNLFIEEQSGTELLSLLQQFRLDWYGFTDVSLYEKEKLCRQLRSSGCRKVLIGFESLNPANLAAIQHTQWKKRRLEQYWQAISCNPAGGNRSHWQLCSRAGRG